MRSNTRGNQIPQQKEEKSNNGWGSALTSIGGSLLGMIGQNARARRQHNRQKELMNIQLGNQKQLNQQGHELQMDMWNKTNYGAQKEHMLEAGLNPALMYGMSGGGGATAGSQGGGSAQGGNAAAPMDIGNALQIGLMKSQIALQNSQAGKNVAETKKIGGIDTEEGKTRVVVNRAEADKKAEEIIALGLQNKENKATLENKIKMVAVELSNAKLDGIKTDEETKGIIEKVKQEWEKVLISGQQMNIQEFKVRMERQYPSIMQVGGKILKDGWSELEKVEEWLRGQEGKLYDRPVINKYELKNK